MAFYRLARLCRGLIVIFFISAPAVSIASNITYTCPHAEVSIETLKPINTNEICLGARDALVFLANLGIEPIRPIVIEIRKNITETISDTAVGCYLEKKHRAVILLMRRLNV